MKSFIIALAASLMALGSLTANAQKSAIVYFSCTGNTKAVATTLASSLGIPALEIVPAEPYTAADIDYRVADCRSIREQFDPASRPAIKEPIAGLDNYDTIYVGFPLWCGKMPKIMLTFFDSVDLAGKTIVPFGTSGSQPITDAVSQIRTLEPNATVSDGQRFEAKASPDAVAAWAQTL